MISSLRTPIIIATLLLTLGILATVTIQLNSNQLPQVEAASTCNLYSPSVAVPNGFGASYNVFNTSQLLVSLDCSGTTVNVTVGNNDPYTYVYNKGYIYKNKAWTPYSLSCSGGVGLIAGAWCPKQAKATISNAPQDATNYILAYACQWRNNAWKCGCKDTTCSTGLWQLQAYSPAAAPVPNVPSVKVPLFGLFETTVKNNKSYNNPFSDVELTAKFTAPSGRVVNFFGFYDGDGNGGQTGNVWKQRFMPDETGVWKYELKFSDGSTGQTGSFESTSAGAKPGPWRQDSSNPRWFKTANGSHFLPIAMHANAMYTPKDWQDAINWSKSKGYNTIILATFNTTNWGKGWGNVTAFATKRGEPNKEVDYTRMNLKMWHEWDDMFQMAADKNIYIGPFAGPSGKYGGQESGKYPPTDLAFFPKTRESFDTSRNKKIIKYFVARQGAYWNLAYWSLGGTEVYQYAVANKQEFLNYGKYLADITPWGRMITGQDSEQWHNQNRRWLSDMNIPKSRKLNTVQTGVNGGSAFPNWGKSNPDNTYWQNALPNNQLASNSYGGFAVMTTEGLWEGQGRATKPLRIIWGFLAAGAHTMWADWNYEDVGKHVWGSIGRGWVPIRPLSEHLFQTNQLGVNTAGDEQLKIATNALKQLNYWKMSPNNNLVKLGSEAYCLAESGKQYLVYAPNGGGVKLDLSSTSNTFRAKWLDPRNGNYSDLGQVQGGSVRTFNAPSSADWVLIVTVL